LLAYLYFAPNNDKTKTNTDGAKGGDGETGQQVKKKVTATAATSSSSGVKKAGLVPL
jgi:hypothetical protein